MGSEVFGVGDIDEDGLADLGVAPDYGRSVSVFLGSNVGVERVRHVEEADSRILSDPEKCTRLSRAVRVSGTGALGGLVMSDTCGLWLVDPLRLSAGELTVSEIASGRMLWREDEWNQFVDRADFDGDGVDDVVLGGQLQRVGVSIVSGAELAGNIAESWNPMVAVLQTENPRGWDTINPQVAGDLDGDGGPDLLLGYARDETLRVVQSSQLRTGASLQLEDAPSSLVGYGPLVDSMSIMDDVDGDGVAELWTELEYLNGGQHLLSLGLLAKTGVHTIGEPGLLISTFEPGGREFTNGGEVAADGDADGNGLNDIVLLGSESGRWSFHVFLR